MEEQKEESEKKTIIVSVPFETFVEYEIKVKDENDMEEIKEALRNINDPSNWRCNPQFYERYGDEFKNCIEKVEKESIYFVDNSGGEIHTVKAGDEIYVGGLGECTVINSDNPEVGIDVTRVKEEDDTVSWQLITESSDIGLETVKVIPKDKEIREMIHDE